MGAADVLERLTALGVKVTPTPHGTLYLEPASLIPADLLDEVRQHKAEVLAVLADACTCPAIDGPAGVGPIWQPCAKCVQRCRTCNGCRRCRLDNPLKGRRLPERPVGDGEPPPSDRPPETETELRRLIDHLADPEAFAAWLERLMDRGE